jgi:hypothetical protein
MRWIERQRLATDANLKVFHEIKKGTLLHPKFLFCADCGAAKAGRHSAGRFAQGTILRQNSVANLPVGA